MGSRKKSYPYVEIRNGQIRCWVPAGERGRKRWVSAKPNGEPFVSPREAHDFAARYRELKGEVEIDRRPRLTFAEAVHRFLDERATSVKPETLRYYRVHLNTWVKDTGPNLPMHRLDRAGLKEFLMERRDRKGVWTVYRAIRAFCRWAYDEEILEVDVLRGVSKVLPPERSAEIEARQPTLEPARVVELIDTIARTPDSDAPKGGRSPQWFSDAVTLIFGTGLRRAGVCGIRLSDVDLANRQLRTVDKGCPVTVYLDDPRVAAAVGRLMLAAQARGDDRVIGLSPDELGHVFKRWSNTLGEPNLKCHALKRAFVTHHERRKIGIKELQAITRHSTAQMALRYARADEAEVRKAVGGMFDTYEHA